MARSKKENELPWMSQLADKYGISLDTILGFYDSITYDYVRRVTKRQRTEEFFELYFEGVKEGM